MGFAPVPGGPPGSPGADADARGEAWFGAHPGAPARAVSSSDAGRLDEVIDADPAGELGPDVLDRFGRRLPFLTKLLAADAPLSLQAHPSAEQARRGFAVEEALGIPRDAPDRTYRDAWPKPELLLALTPFRALCGFRAPAETAGFLATLDVRGLDVVAERLARDGAGALAGLVAWALRDGRDAAIAALPGLRSAAARVREGAWASTARCVVDLADRYPDDPGTVVALLLRLVELAPGQAIHVPDGALHAYLGGAGLEVMASSDNVLRGGLTTKHVDVDALLEVVDPRPLPAPYVPAVRHGHETVYASPTPHFRLSELALGEGLVRLDDRGPQILVAVEVSADGVSVSVASGHGAFVSARAGEVTVTGDGRLLRTTAGDPV